MSRAQRQRIFLPVLACFLAVAFAPSAARALPVPATLDWEATSPGVDPTEWASTDGSHQWDLTGTTLTTPTSSYSGIGAAFSMGAGDSIEGVSLQTVQSGNPSNEDLSLELWFRPGSMAGGQQVLFETGGGVDGLSLLLDDSSLIFRVKDSGTTVTTAAYDLGSDTSEFFQAAITLSLNGTASLYVDGVLATSTSAAGISDFTGNNGSALGGANGNVGGNDGGDLDGYGDFVGEIALLRFYRDQVLTPGEVTQNFDAIATPEPGTALLTALGLAALAWRRSRARRSR